jgi:predicted HD superfamily hydrolase involved in NAD metabolism
LTSLCDIENDLKKKLKKKRFRHTIGVQYTSICLAMRYGEDLNKASYAGLLHDCAKNMGADKLLLTCRQQGLPVTPSEEKNPGLLHGRVGARMAETLYNVKDDDILNAITWHTTGHPDMSLLEKIVFTADYIEPGRDQAPDLERLRQMAFTDLDMAVYLILKQTLDYLKTGSDAIDPKTDETYQFYKGLIESRKAGSA